MIEFLYHDAIKREIAAIERRFPKLQSEGFRRFELLCQKQFHPIRPQQVIGPGKLHRISQNEAWTLWKVEMVVPGSGLRQNQFPRVWFGVKGTVVVFLCIGTHIDNYNNNEMDKTALDRITDVF